MATFLVRAARLYRDGILIAETEPELAWLLLVSALEVAAVQQQVQSDPAEILREAKPDLVAILDASDPSLTNEVAKALARELKATGRFLGFMQRFLPSPPVARPPHDWTRIDWTWPTMKKSLSKIYKYRSVALHEGIPFPPPMCDPPMNERDWPAPAEGLPGISSASTGGVWKSDDLPMSLHTFEYIARCSLQSWWASLVTPFAS
jgi:hypothetical protein